MSNSNSNRVTMTDAEYIAAFSALAQPVAQPVAQPGIGYKVTDTTQADILSAWSARQPGTSRGCTKLPHGLRAVYTFVHDNPGTTLAAACIALPGTQGKATTTRWAWGQLVAIGAIVRN